MAVVKIVPVPGPQGPQGESGGGGNIADFVFAYDAGDEESTMTINNHDMIIRTTRDDGQDADIDINSADDVWITANDEIEISSITDNVKIYTNDFSTKWEFHADGGIHFPDDTVQTTAFTGGPDSHGDFVFDNSTLSVNNETMYIKATDDGDDSAQLVMDPYNGIARISANGGQQTPRYYPEGDWESATWTTTGEAQGQISFVNAPNIVNLVNDTLNYASNVGVVINGTTIGSWNGASTDGNNITIYVFGPNAENTEDASVTEFGFNYVFESKIEIDNDEGEINILARDLTLNIGTVNQRDINITSSDDVTITANDEIDVYAGDNISFISNYGSEQQYEWRMEDNGTLEFPARGRLRNPANSSGDGNGYDTFHIIPDFTRYESDQYLIVDPTAPNHIHIRAGGTQDYSSSELILGGERAHVKVADLSGIVEVQAKKEDFSWTYPNIDPAGGVVYIIDSEVAEPDFGDFMIVDGVKYVITSVTRSEEFGVTSYETTPSFIFNYNENYTFTRDNGNNNWTFATIDNSPALVLPPEDPIIVNMAIPGDITLSAYNGININFADTEGAGLKFPDDTVQTTAFAGGATGSFVSQDGKTITVTNGIITSIEVNP